MGSPSLFAWLLPYWLIMQTEGCDRCTSALEVNNMTAWVVFGCILGNTGFRG